MSKIIITYHTKTGSTLEVAEFLSQKLIDMGHAVDIKPFNETSNLEGYETVIVGAPVNGMMWVPEAMKFVTDKQSELKTKKVAYFALGMMAYQGRKFFTNRVNNALKKPSMLVSPFETAVFGGVAGEPMPKFARFIFGLKEDSKADQRDWSKIEAWAQELDRQL